MSAAKTMPHDYLRVCLEKKVRVKIFGHGFVGLTDNRELVGYLHAYDEHYNLVVGDGIESVILVDQNGTLVKQTRDVGLVFVRADRVVTISPFIE
jgi:U6 snRNA-associated Sm-like protein LSm3